MGVGLAPGFVTTGNSWSARGIATSATRSAATTTSAATTAARIARSAAARITRIGCRVRARRVNAATGGPVALGLQL